MLSFRPDRLGHMCVLSQHLERELLVRELLHKHTYALVLLTSLPELLNLICLCHCIILVLLLLLLLHACACASCVCWWAPGSLYFMLACRRRRSQWSCV